MSRRRLEVRVLTGLPYVQFRGHKINGVKLMTENESRDEKLAEDKAWAESVEEIDRGNFELDSGDEPEGSGGFRMDGPAVDPYADETENEEETDTETSDPE